MLTSGGAPTSEEGIEGLSRIIKQVNGRIGVLAASGVTSDNVTKIVIGSGFKEVHSPCKVLVDNYSITSVKEVIFYQSCITTLM